MKLSVVTLLATVLFFACQPKEKEKKNPYAAETNTNNDKAVSYKLGADGLAGVINKSMFIPFIAQQYGVDASVDIELTIDTAGNVVSVRPLGEKMNILPVVKKAYPKIENRLKGLFTVEAERICWISNKMWKPEIKNGKKVVSTTTLSFDFKTKQMEENLTSIQSNKKPDFGLFTKGKEDIAPKLYYQIGTGLMTEGYYHQAARFFNAVTYLDDTYADAYFNCGLAYKALNNLGAACQNWAIAAKLGDTEALKLVESVCK